MLQRIVLVVCAVAMIGGVASADIAGLNLGMVYGFGMFSDFDADGGDGSGLQTIATNNGAYIFYDNMTMRYFDDTDIGASFTEMVDQSVPGSAKAHFEVGEWHVKLYDPCSPGTETVVFQLGGAVLWYKEVETDENVVDGSGVVTLDPCQTYVDPIWFGGASWASTDGKSGLQTMISNILPVPLEDYATDWASTNVTTIVWADASIIPEPITLVLLSAGAIGLLRKRRG